VGEISLLDPGPASANVRVSGPTTILEFSHQALLAFIKKHPTGALHLLSSLARDLAGRLNRTSDGLVQLGRTGLELVAPAPPDEAGLMTTMLRMLNQGGGVDSGQLPATTGAAAEQSVTRALESLDFFKLLSPTQVQKLRLAMPVKEHRKGQVFWKAGTPIKKERCAVYFILEGQVSVAAAAAQVSQVPVARILHPGDIFGLVTFFDTKFHSATCRAETVVRAAAMTRSEFDSICQSDIALASAFMYAMARQLARDVRACNNRLVNAITSGAPGKTAK
jgi:CRP-like cAMP-binding protein